MDDITRWFLDKAWAVFGVLLGWIWLSRKRELEEMKTTIAAKADRSELDRQRDNIAKLFDEQIAIRKDLSEARLEVSRGFTAVKDLINEGRTQILTELNKKADR